MQDMKLQDTYCSARGISTIDPYTEAAASEHMHVIFMSVIFSQPLSQGTHLARGDSKLPEACGSVHSTPHTHGCRGERDVVVVCDIIFLSDVCTRPTFSGAARIL